MLAHQPAGRQVRAHRVSPHLQPLEVTREVEPVHGRFKRFLSPYAGAAVNTLARKKAKNPPKRGFL
jgi:hypothetical protein